VEADAQAAGRRRLGVGSGFDGEIALERCLPLDQIREDAGIEGSADDRRHLQKHSRRFVETVDTRALFDGKKVLLRIPPGTQPGRKFRIKGQGIEKNGRKGDQLVGIQVTVPDELTPEQQDLMKKFADSAKLPY